MKINWPLIMKIRKMARNSLRDVLRFLNLLEPNVPYMVLSLSKLSVWASLGLTIYVVGSGQGTTEVAGALLTNIGSIGNYAYRRHVQHRTGTGAYGNLPADETEGATEETDSDSGIGPANTR